MAALDLAQFRIADMQALRQYNRLSGIAFVGMGAPILGVREKVFCWDSTEFLDSVFYVHTVGMLGAAGFMADEQQKPKKPVKADAPEQPVKADATKKLDKKTDLPPYDPFILRKVFPKPDDVLNAIAPRVSEMAKTCLYVFDTNTLLAAYHFDKRSFDDIQRIYKSLNSDNRLFVPVQAIREFGRHRVKALTTAVDAVNQRKTNLPSNDPLNCPMLEGLKEYQAVIDTCNELKKARDKYKEALTSLHSVLLDWTWNDRISTLYSEVFTSSHLIDHGKPDKWLLDDRDWRFTHKLPPGYKDGGKSDGGIGDLLIWHSILWLAESKKQNILFVCNEEKPDWVVNSSVGSIATRPELCDEFHQRSGKHFALVAFPRFLELNDADPQTVKEARGLITEIPITRTDLEMVLHQVLSQLDAFCHELLGWQTAPLDLHTDDILGPLVGHFDQIHGQYEALEPPWFMKVFCDRVGVVLFRLQQACERTDHFTGLIATEQERIKQLGEMGWLPQHPNDYFNQARKNFENAREQATEFRKLFAEWIP